MNHRQTEIDVLNGKLSEYGKQFGIPTPVNDLLTVMVKAIQANYDKQYIKYLPERGAGRAAGPFCAAGSGGCAWAEIAPRLFPSAGLCAILHRTRINGGMAMSVLDDRLERAVIESVKGAGGAAAGHGRGA